MICIFFNNPTATEQFQIIQRFPNIYGEKMKKIIYLFTFVAFLVAACSAAPRPTPDISAIVSSTLTAVAQSQQNNSEQAQPASTEVAPVGGLVVKPSDPSAVPGSDYFPPMGTMTGKLSYPSSFIPPMRVVVFTLDNAVIAYTDTAQNQGTYSFDLPEGTYHVIAYPYDPNAAVVPTAASTDTYAGGYTAAVPCGLSVDCTDHTLLNVTVVAGQTVEADPGDWYVPLGTFPPMPR